MTLFTLLLLFPFYKVDEEVRNFGFSPNVEGIFGLIMNFRTYIKNRNRYTSNTQIVLYCRRGVFKVFHVPPPAMETSGN